MIRMIEIILIVVHISLRPLKNQDFAHSLRLKSTDKRWKPEILLMFLKAIQDTLDTQFISYCKELAKCYWTIYD